MNFVIPTVFTAVNRITAPLRQMAASVNKFIGISESGIARQERIFRRLTPAISEAGKQLLSYASSAAIAAGVIGTITFSTQQVMAYEKGLASFRTIVSDLSDNAFAKFKYEISDVAKATKKSTVEVVDSFEKIAGLNADFAKTADGLGAVSKASITLAKASGDELGVSAENLVGIMNQFNLAAGQADRTINVLAAGQAAGAATISEAAESLKVFGAVAKGSNATLEQSNALIQTLAQKSIKGSEAGTALRGVFVRLQKAGFGYKSGQFQINDALEQARAKFQHLHTAKKQDAFLTKTFGMENLTAGRILLDNIGVYKQFTDAVTGTQEAYKAAEINSNTLGVRIDELKAKWVNLITSSNESSTALTRAKDSVKFLTDNMETILLWGGRVLTFFAAWKALIIGSKIVLAGYNIALGITGALSATASVAIGKSNIALRAYKVTTVIATIATNAFGFAQGVLAVVTGRVTGGLLANRGATYGVMAAAKIATAATWLWAGAQKVLNFVMTANPIGLVIVGIAALIALIVIIVKKWDEWGAAVAFFMGPLGMVISLFKSFYDHWEMIKKAFKTEGILGGLKAIGKVILDALLKPLQKVLEVAASLPGIGKYAQQGADNIQRFRDSMFGNDYNQASGNAVMAPAGQGFLPAVNPKVQDMKTMQQTISSHNSSKEEVELTIKDQTGKAAVTKNTTGTGVKVTSTVGFGAWQAG